MLGKAPNELVTVIVDYGDIELRVLAAIANGTYDPNYGLDKKRNWEWPVLTKDNPHEI